MRPLLVMCFRVAAIHLLAGQLLATVAAAQPPKTTEPAPTPLFTDRAAELGVAFSYFNGASGEYYMPEINGAGCAVFDHDDDGDLDLFFVQGATLGPDKQPDDALFPPQGTLGLRHRLFRNDLKVAADGSRTLGFTDVTAESGITPRGYGQGVATGDFDNDGRVDLYVTGHFHNQLLRNNGDGTFTDVSEKAGVDDTRWSVPATFLDFDGDGGLDLFVGNYNDFDYDNHKTCLRVTGAVDYCGPLSYDPVPDRLFRNDGDGTFTDVTQKAGLLAAFGAALGVVARDLTGDGLQDIYVANDQSENQLWVNQGDGTFRDEALLRGVAVSGDGLPQASMGVVAEDFDGDGNPDLLITHLLGETNTHYRNDGRGMFADTSIPSRLGPPSRWATGFGVAAVDYDNDGWLDVLTANGEVRVIEELARQGDPFPLHQPNQLFHNLGGGRFEEVTEEGGPAFELSEVSRGVASGDLDNDGDPDVVIANNNGPARVLVNESGQDGLWLGLRLIGADGKRDAHGARVELHRKGRPALVRWVRTDGSYASGNDPRVLFGLGEAPRVERVRVVWPDGKVESWTDVPIGEYTTLRAGTGAAGDKSPETPAPDASDPPTTSR